MGEPKTSLRSIKQAQQTVSQRIKEIKKQLKRVEELPDSHTTRYWVSFGRITNVRDLAGKVPNLKDVLKKDLAALQENLKHIRTEAWHAQTGEMAHDAWTASRDFNKKAERVLKQAEKRGMIDDGDLAELRAEGEAVLDKFTDLLDRAPSDANMQAVIEHMEGPMSLGATSEGDDSCNHAWLSLGSAASQLRNRVEKRFRAVPTKENLGQLLKRVEIAQMVGRGEYGGLPPEAVRRRPEPDHVVEAGQSLAEISTIFYGSPGYWDAIYLANITDIGEDPTKLPVGLTLRIP